MRFTSRGYGLCRAQKHKGLGNKGSDGRLQIYRRYEHRSFVLAQAISQNAAVSNHGLHCPKLLKAVPRKRDYSMAI